MADGEAAPPPMTDQQLASSILDDIMSGLAPEDQPDEPPQQQQPQDGATEPQDEAPEPVGEGEPGEPEEPQEPQGEPADEDFVEWEGADGKPIRESLAKLVEAYEGKAAAPKVDAETVRKDLRQELEREHAAQKQAIDQARDEYLARLEWTMKIYAPGEKPVREKFVDQSGYFDRDAYEDAKDRWERRAEWAQRVQHAYVTERNKKAEETAQKTREKQNEEARKLIEAWPELGRAEERVKIQESMYKVLQEYGFKPEEVDSVVDHRQFKIIKDLLAYNAMKSAKGPEAVKRKAAPKLVKAAARAADAGANAGKMSAETRQMLDARKKIKANGGKVLTGADALALLGPELGIGVAKKR